jgi:hypothetical protein
MNEEEVRVLIEQAKKEVMTYLEQDINKERAQHIIARYHAAVLGNFVPWMAAAAVSARSVEARFACEENIFVEMHDDHPGILEVFTRETHANLYGDETEKVKNSVAAMRKTISKMHGIKNVTVCAILEGTSEVFIPYLAKLSKLCESNNQQYTDIHGIADVAHADRFVWALAHESHHHTDAEDAIKVSINETLALLKAIFYGGMT